jgi:hypothetical protein
MARNLEVVDPPPVRRGGGGGRAARPMRGRAASPAIKISARPSARFLGLRALARAESLRGRSARPARRARPDAARGAGSDKNRRQRRNSEPKGMPRPGISECPLRPPREEVLHEERVAEKRPRRPRLGTALAPERSGGWTPGAPREKRQSRRDPAVEDDGTRGRKEVVAGRLDHAGARRGGRFGETSFQVIRVVIGFV